MHYFKVPLPYARTLALQESLHALQLEQRKTSGAHKDILLLLQHRPIYRATTDRSRARTQARTSHRTQRRLRAHAARRAARVPRARADHGLPAARPRAHAPALGAREYISRMQRLLGLQLREAHGLRHVLSEHTGVFVDARTEVGSIGLQVRHRMTTHGFAYNVMREPVGWLDEIMACGLSDMDGGSVEGAVGEEISVECEIPGLVERFGRVYEREMAEMDVNREGRVGELIADLEEEARRMEPPPSAPFKP